MYTHVIINIYTYICIYIYTYSHLLVGHLEERAGTIGSTAHFHTRSYVPRRVCRHSLKPC